MENDKNLKSLPIRLKDYIDTHKITNKDIARIFGYAEQNISDYLQNKAADNSKLHTITKLFLELEELKETKYSENDIEKLETMLLEYKNKNARMEGEIFTLKEMISLLEGIIRDFSNKK